jgi:hypothetical protein
MVLENPTRSIVLFDPTVDPDPVESTLAPRLSSLDGKVVGLLANGKRNSMELLDRLEEILAERYGVRQVLRETRPNVSRPAPPEIVDRLVANADLVLTAIGD